ncbi:MAG: Gfo/Idh/MocA family protein [Vicinamibacterales bacterium]
MPLRWGILGTARINRMLIPAIRASSRSVLAAVASRTRDRADRYAAEWSIPRAFESYAALLDDAAIDVVYIPLPNSLHVEWTIRALDAGKHVLCEKPLALSVEGIDRIAEAASRARRVVAEAFMYRHHPITTEAERLIASGALGPLETIHGAFTFALTRESDVRLDPSLGGGSLWDVGCYPVSYACLLAGQPAEAFGWAEMAGGVDFAFHGMLRLASDAVVQFDCGFRGPFRAAIEIVGREASLTIERPFRTDERSRLVLTRGDVVEQLRFEAAPAFTGEIDDIERAALGERAPRVSLAESRRTTAAITALYESARRGRVVHVDRR